MKRVDQRPWVAQALIGLMCVMLVGLAGRLVHLQAGERPALLAWSRARQTSTIPLPGRRGAILDRRLRVLAASQDLPTVYADPREIEDPAETARELATVLALPADEIEKLLRHPTSPGYVVIQRGLDPLTDKDRKALVLNGIGVRDEPVRTYPVGTLAAQVLGFVGRDGEGLEGIEMAFADELGSRPGQRVVFRDVRRRPLFQQAGSHVPPCDGVDVVLTLDVAIQEVVERAVGKQVEHFKAECGLGVVMDPKTGEVLAMATVPTFDPGQGASAPAEVRRNRVLTDPVEPGSVFKPYVMAAAIAAGLTRPEETIFCHNGLYVCGKRFLHDHHVYGNLTTAAILSKSSNIGMAILGQRLGNKRMYEALRAFGFGRATGIDLPGESNGPLRRLDDWDSYSTTSVPMGQELAVTPIQFVTAFSALANGGRLLQPRVVRAIMDRHGRVLEDRSEVIDRGQAIDPGTAATMHDLLVNVVKEGTGRRCNLEKWQVMGKTGTAQVPRIGQGRRGYEPNAYLGSFIAAAPASDPAVVVLVMIRKPQRSIGYYGSVVALPAVRAILEETLPYLEIPPDKPAGDDGGRLVTAKGRN